MKMFRSHLLAIGVLASLPGSAFAAQAELNSTPVQGATISSNNDSSPGEAFIVNDSNEEVINAVGGGTTNISNTKDVVLNYNSNGVNGGSFAIKSGGTTVLSANNAGNLSVDNALSVDTNGSSAGGTRLSVTSSAVTTTSTDGNTSSTLDNSGYAVSHVDGTATNSIAVGATQQTTIGANSFFYGTTITGGALVQGDLGVNGSIYALNPTASTGINVGNNGLAVNGATNTTSLVADSNGSRADGGSQITLQENQAGLVVYNAQTGVPHGLLVGQTSTVLSGGTASTSLTLNDNGATFTNSTTGGPARVTGVADGNNRFDAVNFGQLKSAYGGVASVAAMANVPAPAPGKSYSIGIGYGNFEGENACGGGGAARVSESVSIQASLCRSDDKWAGGAGVGVSW